MIGFDRAGRARITVYFFLIAIAALRMRRRFVHVPVALLLFFPLATSAPYFQGLLNYLLTLPMLLIALDDLRASSRVRWTARHVGAQLLLLAVILWCHPFTLGIYAVLALCDVALTRDSMTRPAFRLLPTLAALLALYACQTRITAGDYRAHWWPLSDNVKYLGQMFYGMRSAEIALLWHGAAYCALLFLVIAKYRSHAIDRRDVAQALLLEVGYFSLPFWVGKYSYFNLRLAPLLYFQLAIMLASVSLDRASALLVAALSLCFTVDASYLQLQIGRESAEILPLLDAVPAEQKVVSIPFEDSSDYLDRSFYSQMHRHDVFYYQLAAGGESPHLWRLPLVPIHYKSPALHPEPHSIHELIEQDYRVVFARNAPASFVAALEKYFTLQRSSGRWSVFERRKSMSRSP